MKPLLTFCPFAFLFFAAASVADPITSEFTIQNRDFKISYYDLPEFPVKNANFTGIKRKKLDLRDLMKDPRKNHLTLIVNYDPFGTADNLSWTLEERDVPNPFDRDQNPTNNTEEGISSELFKGQGRLFLNKRTRGEIEGRDLARKKVTGTTSFEAGNGSLVIIDPTLNANMVVLDQHQGSVSIKGKLNSAGDGNIIQFQGKVIGTVFIGDPSGLHQVMITIDINAKR